MSGQYILTNLTNNAILETNKQTQFFPEKTLLKRWERTRFIEKTN